MAKTSPRRKTGARNARRKNDERASGSGVLREVALQLPDVEDATTARGIAFKVRGRLITCSAIHESAEPGSVVVRVSPERRARLMATYPDALYLTEHYSKHPAVLARLARLDRDSLRDILGEAWLFVTEKTVGQSRRPSRRKR